MRGKFNRAFAARLSCFAERNHPSRVGIARQCHNVSPMRSSKKQRRDDEVTEDSGNDWTPPVMWSESRHGFEADPLSPAGMSQQIWRATGRRPRSRTGLWLVRIVCLVIALAFIAAQVAH
jgi:hypothetical protein